MATFDIKPERYGRGPNHMLSIEWEKGNVVVCLTLDEMQALADGLTTAIQRQSAKDTIDRLRADLDKPEKGV